jgi:hypothetical protein
MTRGSDAGRNHLLLLGQLLLGRETCEAVGTEVLSLQAIDRTSQTVDRSTGGKLRLDAGEVLIA